MLKFVPTYRIIKSFQKFQNASIWSVCKAIVIIDELFLMRDEDTDPMAPRHTSSIQIKDERQVPIREEPATIAASKVIAREAAYVDGIESEAIESTKHDHIDKRCG